MEYLNVNNPLSNVVYPDGVYPWMRIAAGGQGSIMNGLKLTANLDMDGNNIINRGTETSSMNAMVNYENNTTATVCVANTPQIPVFGGGSQVESHLLTTVVSPVQFQNTSGQTHNVKVDVMWDILGGAGTYATQIYIRCRNNGVLVDYTPGIEMAVTGQYWQASGSFLIQNWAPTTNIELLIETTTAVEMTIRTSAVSISVLPS